MTQFEQKGYTVIVFWIPSFSGLRVQRFTVRSVLSSHDRTFGSLDLVEETEDLHLVSRWTLSPSKETLKDHPFRKSI